MDDPSHMRALVYRGINDLQVETVPVPQIGEDEILVKVACCGVCPTDIKKIQYGTVPPPRIFGHETSGTIVRVGKSVNQFQVGERVALHHHVPCLKCHACAHGSFAQCTLYKKTGITAGFEPSGGGYAEYVRVMNFCLPGVVPIPDANSFEEGALLEPVNTVLKGVQRLGIIPGDRVLVAGQGPIGLMFTRLLTLAGARVLATDLLKERLEKAKAWGAEWALSSISPEISTVIQSVTSGLGLDAAVLAVPAEAALLQAQALVRGGGKILLFAHTRRGDSYSIDLSQICVDEVDLIGSYSSDFKLQETVANLVFSRKIDVRELISHRFSLEEGALAIEKASHPTPESLKIMVQMSPNSRAEAQ